VAGDTDDDLDDVHNDTFLSPADEIGDHPDEDNSGTEEHTQHVNSSLHFVMFSHI